MNEVHRSLSACGISAGEEGCVGDGIASMNPVMAEGRFFAKASLIASGLQAHTADAVGKTDLLECRQVRSPP